MSISLRGSLFDNSELPVAGRNSFPAENFEGTESVGVRELSIPLFAVRQVERPFGQIVGRGTPERGDFGLGTLREIMSDSPGVSGDR
jgi:hypothetical protein